jgi:transposase-like protein
MVMAPVLSDPRFRDEEAAYAWVEERLWPNGPVCPHCGVVDNAAKLGGKSTRIGVYKCRGCRKPFRVTVGTVMEASHIKLHIWLQALHLMTCSKKGISSNQLHRVLGIGLRAAWFLSHRIREAMRGGTLAPLGGNGGVVEADETYFGKLETPRKLSRGRIPKPTKGGRTGPAQKRAIIALVERGGSVRSFHVENADKLTVNKIIAANVAREAVVYTDESRIYGDVAGMVAAHEKITHSLGEYVRGNVHTNNVEGSFGVFKRGMKGIYQHCDEKHLHRYLAEFDFRFNNRVALGIHDAERADRALLGVVGKRLTYRTAH